MNVTIELPSELETRLQGAAARHNLNTSDLAPQAVQELLTHAVNWWPENLPNVEALLEELALIIRAQQEDDSEAGRGPLPAPG